MSLLDVNSAPPTVRRPVFAVQFGGGSGDSWQNSLVAVTVECGLAPFVDAVEVLLSADSQAPTVAVGDTGTIALGYEDDDKPTVFTGQVESIGRRTTGMTRLMVVNGGISLARLRANQSYDQQKAGDIVKDLAQQAGVDTDQVEDGVAFPYYVVDDRRNAHQHLAQLGLLCDFLVFLTPEGKLNFVSYGGASAVQNFTYGDDILSLEVVEAATSVGVVTATGEGAAGSQGQAAWSRLLKDPSSVQGKAGDGKPERALAAPAARSAEGAASAAKGYAGAAALGTITGTLLTAGAPAVTVGSSIEIAQAPQSAQNGTFLVRRVRHRYSKSAGFTSRIVFSKVGGGGAAGGLL